MGGSGGRIVILGSNFEIDDRHKFVTAGGMQEMEKGETAQTCANGGPGTVFTRNLDEKSFVSIKNGNFTSEKVTFLMPSKTGFVADIIHIEYNAVVHITGSKLTASELVILGNSTLELDSKEKLFELTVSEQLTSDNNSTINLNQAQSVLITCEPPESGVKCKDFQIGNLYFSDRLEIIAERAFFHGKINSPNSALAETSEVYIRVDKTIVLGLNSQLEAARIFIHSQENMYLF